MESILKAKEHFLADVKRQAIELFPETKRWDVSNMSHDMRRGLRGEDIFEITLSWYRFEPLMWATPEFAHSASIHLNVDKGFADMYCDRSFYGRTKVGEPLPSEFVEFMYKYFRRDGAE